MKLINIGFGSMVSANRLVAIIKPDLRTAHEGCDNNGQ